MTMEEAQTFYLRYVNYAVPEKIREQERRFLDDVTSGQGFKSSESGLRYDVTRDGDLKRTIASDTARIAVRIKALRRDGGEIYSSYERGDTLRTRLDSLPAGLREGLKLLGSGGAVVKAPYELLGLTTESAGFAMWNDCWLDFYDMLTEGIMMPLGALLMSLLMGWVFPNLVKDECEQSGHQFKGAGYFKFCFRFVIPIIMVIVLITQIQSFFL